MKIISILALFFSLVLTACSVVVCPEDGKYYCEELDMTWDFENNYAFYTKDGVDYLLITEVDHDGHTTISRRSDYAVVLEGQFTFEDNVVSIKTDGGTIYTFVFVQ